MLPTPSRLGRKSLLFVLLLPLAVACGPAEQRVPSPPAGVTASAGDASATVTWTAPDDGGSAITGYTVTSSPGGRTAQVNGSTLTVVVSELTNGTPYSFAVTATNALGTSLASAPSNTVTPQGAPGAPTAVVATPGNEAATVTWTAPGDDGGSAITGYTVTSSPGGHTAQAEGATLTATVAGLSNGTAYTFTVTATNAAGAGAASAPSAAVTPLTVPGAPTGAEAMRGDGEATVSWLAPEDDGGSPITGYTVTSSPQGAQAQVNGATLTATLGDLDNGTSYTFTVVATNAAGDGAASVATNPVTPATVPSAPQQVTAAPGDGSVTVSWTAPEWNGGSAVTGYTVVASPGQIEVTVDAESRSAVVEGLTPGTSYTFTVVATNDVGRGPASASSNEVVLVTSPGAPTDVVAVRGDARATVTWSAPGSDGGSPVTGYAVTASPGGETLTTDAQTRTATFTGLSNGTAYTFTVTATNEVGPGDASAASAPVIPATRPGAPQQVAALRGTGEATVTWMAPASDGGLAVTGYLVTSTPDGRTARVDGATLSATITGLTNGTAYTFTVTATNEVGDGDASEASDPVVPATRPDAPAAPVVEEGYGAVTVSWQAPGFDGWSAISSYRVTSSPGAVETTVDGATLTAVVDGLTNGTPYTFTVEAVNDIGPSEASAASERAVPGPTAGKSTLTAVATVPPSALADGADVLTLTITARSTSGRLLANVPVTLASDEATDVLSVEAGSTDESGQLVSLVTATKAGSRYYTAELGSPATAVIGATATFTAPPAWATTGGGAGYDGATDLVLDGSGFTYLVGTFAGTSFFGGTTLTSGASSKDVLVARLSPEGNWLWAVKAGGNANDEAVAVALDPQGNIYVTGSFSETASFGAATLTAVGATDLFVAKLSPQGDWLWAVQAGGETGEGTTDLAVDDQGNVYVTGYFQSEISFGTTTLESSGSNDVFVAKLSPDRQWLWAAGGGGAGNDQGYRIAVDGKGDVHVAGHFSGEATFDEEQLSATGSFDPFVAKLSPQGAWLRARSAKGTAGGYTYAEGLIVDELGACYLSGSFFGGLAFGADTLASAGQDAYVARLSPEGDWDWGVRAGGASTDTGGRIALGKDGDLRVVGKMGSMATFGEHVLRADLASVFVARLSSTGTWHWAVKAEADFDAYLTGLAVDPHGHARVAGRFANALTLGTFSADTQGGWDAFAATVSPAGDWYSEP